MHVYYVIDLKHTAYSKENKILYIEMSFKKQQQKKKLKMYGTWIIKCISYMIKIFNNIKDILHKGTFQNIEFLRII